MRNLILVLALVALSAQAEDTITTKHGIIRGEIVKDEADGITIRVYSEIKVDKKTITEIHRDVPVIPPAPPADFVKAKPATSTVPVQKEESKEDKMYHDSLVKATIRDARNNEFRRKSTELSMAHNYQVKLLEKDPDNPELKANVALLLKRIQDYNEVIRKAEEADGDKPAAKKPTPGMQQQQKTEERTAKEVVDKMEF